MSLKKVWIVTKGQYSDMSIVAVKSNKEAAERLIKKCSTCDGRGKDRFFDFPCYDCKEENRPANKWNKPIEMELEDE